MQDMYIFNTCSEEGHFKHAVWHDDNYYDYFASLRSSVNAENGVPTLLQRKLTSVKLQL